MRYRPEIDGLRAFAILPVVAFHAGVEGMPGGFAGVDVFFVISGYLITGLVAEGVRAGAFSYAAFFARRARRILPALVVMVLATLVAASLVALPDVLDQAAQSAIPALAGVSNIFFWKEAGYFSLGAKLQPLLNTWSLGVEEQFYLILPLALIALHRYRIDLGRAFRVTLPVAFLLGLWLSHAEPDFAFYMLPARAWELMLGGALALGVFPKVGDTRVAGALAVAGLGLLTASFFAVDTGMPYPGFAALAPCIGTALVIHCGGGGDPATRLLRVPVLRGIGLISYSLYLWHWPVLVLAPMWLAVPALGAVEASAAVALSFLLAAASWRWIETPFRRGRVDRRRALALGVPTAGIAMALAGWIMLTDGWPGRLDPVVLHHAAASRDIDPLRGPCRGAKALSAPECVFGGGDGSPDFLLIGDSHASSIRPAVARWAERAGRRGIVVWQSDCAGVWGITRVPDRYGRRCPAFERDTAPLISAMGGIRTVFLAGRWEQMYSGLRPDKSLSERSYLIDAEDDALDIATTRAVLERGLDRFARRHEAAGREVVFIGAVPEPGFDVPRILSLAALNDRIEAASPVEPPLGHALRREIDAMFGRLTAGHPARRYLSLWEAFCDPRCRVLAQGDPVYRDSNHISYTAADGWVAEAFIERMATLPGS